MPVKNGLRFIFTAMDISPQPNGHLSPTLLFAQQLHRTSMLPDMLLKVKAIAKNDAQALQKTRLHRYTYDTFTATRHAYRRFHLDLYRSLHFRLTRWGRQLIIEP